MNNRLEYLTNVLDSYSPSNWEEINAVLNELKIPPKTAPILKQEITLQQFARGTAFITFGLGIDGVSIEISKYANALKNLYREVGISSIHLIAGEIHPEASSIINDAWHTHTIAGINGWDKWENGKWFRELFAREMKPNSPQSSALAKEIFRQAGSIAKTLGEYIIEHQISLLLPVNINSNPGNFSLALAVVLVSELLGIFVLNSNHDFYWESGEPPANRAPGEEPGVRDHFFRNIQNKPFFTLLENLYPWDGKKWLQLNINARQTRKLTNKYGFSSKSVSEISTCVGDRFFDEYSSKDVKQARLRMGHILSGGQAILSPIPVNQFSNEIGTWMQNEKPVILGVRAGLAVDSQSDDLIILLQPTRIVNRKRIERGMQLIESLLRKGKLRKEFDTNPNKKIILHISGPTPREHQADLETVLHSYSQLIDALPQTISERVFIALSVGQEEHTSFEKKRFRPMHMAAIYRMADAVLFPSESEGRGLPIIEASAIGVPIICSRYHPHEVFDDVVGKGLPKNLRLHYTLFPEGKLSQPFLSKVADLLINPESKQTQIAHNRNVVKTRFSQASLTKNFKHLLTQFLTLE